MEQSWLLDPYYGLVVIILHPMFWGHTLKQGETLNLTKEEANGALLHLSHVSLNPASKPGATTLFITHGERKFALVTLAKEGRDFQTLDLYFNTSTSTSFSLIGPGEVNLLGYFEPSDEGRGGEEESSEEEEPVMLPQKGGMMEEEDSEEEDSESEEEVPVSKPKAAAQMEDDSDEDGSDESDEEVKVPVKPAPAAQPKSAKQPQIPAKVTKPPQPVPAPQKKPKPTGQEGKPTGGEGKHKPAQQPGPPQEGKPKKHSQKPVQG